MWNALLLALAPALFGNTHVLDGEIQLTTQDGQVMLGTPSIKNLKLATEYGSAEIRVERVARVEFGDPDTITTVGGQVLTGTLDLPRLRLTTEEGKRTIKRAELATWITLVDGALPITGELAGKWWSTFGPMELTQDGNRFEGTYGFGGAYPISGTIDGRKLDVEYGDGGKASLELWESGDFFNGSWQAKNGREGRWGAYRHDPRPAERAAGKITLGQTEVGMRYHLRLPKDWKQEVHYPGLVVLHGSNMSADAYVNTLAVTWPELAERFVLIGLDGEQMNGWSEKGQPSFNYTYINYSGPGVGPEWVHRQSPALVAEALEQLGKEFGIERWIVGGHSQGGFLTYAVGMYYPELLRGAFPMSCGLLVQCEPDIFDEEQQRARQRRLAWAPIHGKRDDVVDHGMSSYAHGIFLDQGFPRLRFFSPERVGHQFAFLPVDEAVNWILELTTDDPERALSSAEEALEAKNWRDAIAALERARELGADAERTESIEQLLRQASEEPAARLQEAIEKNQDAAWVEDFLAFRADFAHAESAAPVMAAYAKLREVHQPQADDWVGEARQLEDRGQQEALWRRVLEEAYASSWYPTVKRWLSE